jgi:periplasmic divalent cation tolerance protein
MADFMQVVTTVDSEESGERLARGIVDARLAACVQIVGPIRSLYWWQGSIDDTREWQLIIKTISERLAALEAHIKENHSYETPEITVTEIVGGSREYLDWISAETRTAASS